MSNFLEIERLREAIKSKLPNQLNSNIGQVLDKEKKTSFMNNSEIDVTLNNTDESPLNTSLQLMKSCRGKDILLLNDIPFYKEKAMSNGNIYWKCQLYHLKQCSSRAITKDMKLVSCTPHNHTLTLTEKKNETRTMILKKKYQPNVFKMSHTNNKLVKSDNVENADLIDGRKYSESKLLEDDYSSSDNEMINYQKSGKCNTFESCKRKSYSKISPKSRRKKAKISSNDVDSDTLSDYPNSNESFSTEKYNDAFEEMSEGDNFSSHHELENIEENKKIFGSRKRKPYKILPVSRSKKAVMNSIDTNSDTSSDYSNSNASSTKYMSKYMFEDYGFGEWDDPNVLVNRLCIIISSTNTDLYTYKEMSLIINELREAGYIE